MGRFLLSVLLETESALGERLARGNGRGSIVPVFASFRFRSIVSARSAADCALVPKRRYDLTYGEAGRVAAADRTTPAAIMRA
jgi:hypothetical protein